MFNFVRNIINKKQDNTPRILEVKPKLSEKILSLFKKNPEINSALHELEELLILNDFGIEISGKIVAFVKENYKNDGGDMRQILKNVLRPIISQNLRNPFDAQEEKVKIILFSGVNGSGKTTTIGKIAYKLSSEGRKVLIAACDTFRAAASSQLEFWANKAGAKIVQAGKDGVAPATVLYNAIEILNTSEEKYDYLLIDTSGRLQNKVNLMEELGRMYKILKKFDSNAPHESILVIDANIGQNAISQFASFNEIAKISGVIVTKMDGAANGGIIVPLIYKFSTAVFFIGIGERVEDLQEFDPDSFLEMVV